MAKWVYMFTEGNADMRNLLGGKGANLAEMTNLGLPVPQGFTVTTEACTQYYEDGREINDEIQGQINEYIGKMEEITGKKFGDKENPLLVSVRSGARASMPGMMDTILNLGLNETVVEVLAEKSNNPRWAWDCYRRFIQMYSDVVMEVGKKYFEQLIDAMKEKKGVVYYNDSKGTNPDAAIKGIQAMNRPTLLIGGGYDKESSYDEWIESFDGKVRYLVLIGQTKEKIKAAAERLGFTDIILCEDLKEAVQICAEKANPGDAVLLSPACASWGQFDNYEQRGDMFKEYVKAL